VGSSEQEIQRAALRGSHQGRPLGAGGVHHGAHIVHALLQVRQLVDGYGVGQASPTLIEKNESTEGGETTQGSRGRRLLPQELEMGDPSMDDN